MNDDELRRALSAARPDTAADHDWAASADAAAALAAVHDAAEHTFRVHGIRIRLPRPVGTTGPRRALAGLAAVAAVVTAGSLVLAGALDEGHGSTRHDATGPRRVASSAAGDAGAGVRPHDLLLTGYDTCGAALSGLRAHAAAHVTADGLPSGAGYRYGAELADTAPSAAAGSAVSGAAPSVPDHSGTNDQEAGADEPDTVKTDGRRIVTVAGSELHVVDAATRTQTGHLDLGAYAGSDSAQLLLSGDRLLVLLGGTSGDIYPVDSADLPAAGTATTVLLVDLADATPRIVSMFRPKGELVDARLVGGTARLVVRNAPDLHLRPATESKASARKADYAAQVARAPISAWLPGWSVTSGSSVSDHTVGCGDVTHPSAFTGLSMLTVYSVDPSAGFGDVAPVSLAADGSTVYATTSSLYITSDTGSGPTRDSTQVHRFDIDGSGPPAYLGSGTVPGSVADSYSLSDWQGSLRIVTTRYLGNDETHDLYVLDAATLTRQGHVGGIGKGEDLHAVRFLGGLGYVVTYQQIDPLFVLDLRDPEHPRVAGELKVTGYSGYLHDVGDGRLLGIGEATVPNAQEDGMAKPIGLQVQLFDVTDPARPTSLDTVVRKDTAGDGDIDPHAFLYWADRHLAVVPIPTWDQSQTGSALLVRVDGDRLTTLGTVTNPPGDDGSGITRTVVVGDSLWTVSDGGLVATDLDTLQRQATVPFG